jgi:hypothetical protein
VRSSRPFYHGEATVITLISRETVALARAVDIHNINRRRLEQAIRLGMTYGFLKIPLDWTNRG